MSVPASTQGLPLPAWSPRAEHAWQRTLTWALASLGFFAPFSTAGTYVTVGVLLALALAAPLRVWRTGFWREGTLVLSLALLAYIAVHSLLEEGWQARALKPPREYHELLLLPLLWALMRMARRPQAFANGLMAGSLLLAAGYWVGWAADLTRENVFGSWLHWHRISAGFTLAVSAFVLFEHTRLGHLRWSQGIPATLFVAGAVLFASDGRTGHLLLFLLAGCAALRAVPRRARLWGIPALLIVAVAVAASSGALRHRIQETIADTQAIDQMNATAIRLRLMRNALAVAQEHWLLGAGWVGYREVFHRTAQRNAASTPGEIPAGVDGNPHSEYLLQLGAGGVPALALFLAWLAWPMARAVRRRTTDPWSGALGCVVLAFAVAALFNSVLLDFIEAHYYAALVAWLMARRVAGEVPCVPSSSS